jgi:hypothetical protein
VAAAVTRSAAAIAAPAGPVADFFAVHIPCRIYPLLESEPEGDSLQISI